MTDTQHTPGPWKIWAEITAISRNPCTGHTISRGDDVFICDAVGTSAADARLIAACPEMLDALRAAAELIDYAIPKFDWGKSALDGKAIQLLNEVPITVRAAIAKATGA